MVDWFFKSYHSCRVVDIRAEKHSGKGRLYVTGNGLPDINAQITTSGYVEASKLSFAKNPSGFCYSMLRECGHGYFGALKEYEPNITAYHNEIKNISREYISYSDRLEKINEITMRYNPVALYFVLENGNTVYF